MIFLIKGKVGISGSDGGEFEVAVFFVVACVVWYKFTDVSEVLAASVIRAIARVGLHGATTQKRAIVRGKVDRLSTGRATKMYRDPDACPLVVDLDMKWR
jgi:hypothetical protein